ncbi:spermatogenesis-associated protein 7-like [Ambystoma mexicanum]|uniref:spermatogenesis-associated protein 7-like n=1 Tax=Ambystoma mexicanum TaxID=8296 RepID=UPI0037E90941
MSKRLAPRGSQSAMIPKYSMMGPFRGHMSLKSSPFHPGSSCKLSTQYIIQDHMATHYRRVLTAKAAVDSSAPNSLQTSIKYKDQKKKEQLIAAVGNYKKEILRIRSTSPLYSRSVSPKSPRWPSNEQDSLILSETARDVLSTQEEEHMPIQKRSSRNTSPVAIARDTVQSIVRRSVSPSERSRRSMTVVPSTARSTRSLLHMNSLRTKKPFQDPQTKTYSGDLIDKHSNWFSAVKKPFSPRTLKKSAKPWLSKYKYYSSPKKGSSNDHLSSRNAEEYHYSPTETYRSLQEMYLKTYEDENYLKPMKQEEDGLQPKRNYSHRSQLLEKEEELKYLQFLLEVTEDIVTRGYCSSKVMNDVFREQLKSRRRDLDEVKMKKYFRELTDQFTNHSELDFSISYNGYQHNDSDIQPSFLRYPEDSSSNPRGLENALRDDHLDHWKSASANDNSLQCDRKE